MADRKKKSTGKPRANKSGGRVTPKGGVDDRGPERAPGAAEPTPQVGRRPSNPMFLFGVAGMWILVGVVIWTTFSATWKLVPAVVSIGLGLLFLRGAVMTVSRHEERA